MPEIKQPSRRDLERLSAYLDGMLAEREARQLEARLQADPGMRQQLEELQQTVSALRTLPEVRLPRNFTLTHEMVGIMPRRNLFPVMRAATAFAVLALVVTIGFDALMNLSLGGAATLAEPDAMEMVEAPAPLEGVIEGEDEETQRVFTAEEAAPRLEAEEEDRAAGAVEGVPEEEAAADMAAGEELSEAPVVEEPAAAAPATGVSPTELPKEQETPTVPLPSTALDNTVQSADDATPREELEMPAQAPASRPSLPIVRLVEIALAILVMILASFTLWLRHRS